MNTMQNIPKGFEKKPEPGANIYKAGAPKQNAPTTVNFRGRPGGPGRGMGQTVEHAENVGVTLSFVSSLYHPGARKQDWRYANKVLFTKQVGQMDNYGHTASILFMY